MPCGDDPEEHITAVQRYVDAGYDEVYISQVGPTSQGFFDFYAEQVLPAVRGRG